MKREKRKIIAGIGTILTVSTILVYNIYIKDNINDNDINNINSYSKIITYKENKTNYEAKDGLHNIYWAQGINPPKMTNDENLLGKDGYFYLENIGNFSTYTAEYIPGNGYYDYNKNLDSRGYEHPLCYLGAASNLITWWLEQNKEYVNEYKRRLRETDIYEQDPNLHSLLPYDNNLWKEITEKPGIENQNGFLAQKLGKSPLVTKHLKPYYYKKDDGYASDVVMDFFFNGYDAIPTEEMPNENNENNFVKDPRGGYFYPLLNKERITDRITGTNITSLNNLGNNLRKLFREGKGIVLAYLVNPIQAHAITVWGAEYDSNGKLIRIFVTDSDDFQPAKDGDKYWRGLVGMNVVPDAKGVVTLTNQREYNLNKPGVYLTHIMTLDLAKDKLEEKLNDTKAPIKPIIKNEPNDKISAVNANMTFKVEVTKSDNGHLEYAWYEANTKTDKGIKINNSNSDTLNIKASKIGTKYYYCQAINVKNGKQAISETKHFKVEVKDIELINAETPTLNFNYNTITYNQYDTPKKILVEANVTDGGTLSYQWYKTYTSEATNGVKLNGETKPYLIPPTDKPTNGLYYYCIVTNTKNEVTGNTTASATTRFAKRIKVIEKKLIEAKPPLITKQPTNVIVRENEKVKLEINAISEDSGTISYEWFEIKNGIDIALNNNTNIYNVPTNSIGKKLYRVKVTNTNRNATHVKEKSIFSKTVTVEIKELEKTNAKEPNIVEQPKNITVYIDEKAELKVNAKSLDSGVISYEWFEVVKGNDIPLKITTNKFTPDTSSVGKRSYRVKVTNYNDKVNNIKENSSFSNTVIVTVKEIEKTDAKEPSIIEQPTSLTVHKNEPVQLRINATSLDFGEIHYEWFEVVNGNDKPLNVTTNTYTPITNIVGEKSYRVKVTNINNNVNNIKEKSVYSNIAKVIVKEKEIILSNDNELKNLEVKNGNLNPKFDKNVHDYKITIPHDSDKLLLDTKIHDKATISIVNPTLKFGETKNVVITIIAENGNKNKYTIEVTKDKNHTYGNWKMTLEPSCTTTGIEERVCPFDGHKEIRTVQKLGHDYQDDWTFEKLPTENDEGIKYHKCSRCGAKKDITIVPKLNNHIKCIFGKWEKVKKSTCTEEGLEVRSCQICGKKEYRKIKALGHDFDDSWTFDKLPTELETGIKSHHCKRCEVIIDETTVPKLESSHTVCSFENWIIIKKPTYEENGLRKKVCTICGKEITEIIPKLEKKTKQYNRKTYVIVLNSIIIILILTIILTIFIKKKKN